MKLHESPELFEDLILRTGERFIIEHAQIEKDYWITKVLKDIADSEFCGKVHFKGGTSLSKAYGMISRFSEDLDLYVDTGKPTAGGDPEKKLNSNVYKYILSKNKERHVTDDPNAQDKTGGDFRKLHLHSNVIFPAEGLRQYLQIESMISVIKARAEVYHPTERRTVNSLIGEYLKENGREDLIEQFGLHQFACWCISPKETLCDKISRMARLSQKDDNAGFAEHVRDFYDVYSLMSDAGIRNFFNSEEFLRGMTLTNNQDWLQHKSPHTQQPYSKARIFSRTKEVFSDVVVINAFKGLKKLMMNGAALPSIEHIAQTISGMKQRIVAFDNYRDER